MKILLRVFSFWVVLATANATFCQCTYIYGTLQSDPAHSSTDYNSGIKLATLELGWDSYEPQEGVFNTTYISSMLSKMQSFQSAGLAVVLDVGFQYPPSWIINYANSRYKNQFGELFVDGSGWNGVNAIFNQAMRDKQEQYLARVIQDFGAGNFYAIRLGWGWFGELNYPRASFNNHSNCYWAFDDIAQGRTAGLPSGMTTCPVPGWIPGTASQNHTLASQFITWYLNSLKNYHDWQITTLRRYYAGRAPMLYPGWGVRPGQLDGAIAVDLNGSTSVEINGELQRGSDFSRFVNGLTDANVYVYTTWLNATGTEGSSNQADWSPIHYLANLALTNPVTPPTWGENSGSDDYTAMQHCFAQMQAYHLHGIIWAFEPQLYSGTYATISQYSGLISQYCPAPSAPLISQGRPVTTSSAEGAGLGGTNAVDGNLATRWSSGQWTQPNSTGWLYVDLGSAYNITQARIDWEAAYAGDYQIQVSNDAATWSPIQTVTGNRYSGWVDYTGLSGSGRYVRLYCTALGPYNNYSAWEFQVYGNAVPTSTLLSQGHPTFTSSVEGAGLESSKSVDGNLSTRWSSGQWAQTSSVGWIYVDLGSSRSITQVKLDWEAAIGRDYKIQISSNANKWTTLTTVTGNTSSGWLTYNVTGSGRYVRVYCTAPSPSINNYSLYEFQVFGN